jgi:hypothetical protein
MDITVAVVGIIVVVVVILVVAGVTWEVSRRRSARLQQRFGPEYERTVEQAGGQREAETDLREREKRHEELHLRTLPPETRNRYRRDWDGIQQRFVDVPGQAVQDADELVRVIMRDIGYPVDDFEQRASDMSVEHPEVVEHYRVAHSVAVAQRQGQAQTEPLRQAVTNYRALVDDLLESKEQRPEGGPSSRDEQ